MAILDISAAKLHLNIDATTDDVEITGWLGAVDRAIEIYAGRDFTRKTITEHVRGGRVRITPDRSPIASVDNLAPFLGTSKSYASGDLKTDGQFVYQADGLVFQPGLYTLTYSVGDLTPDIPDNVKQAALIVLSHMWETQRGTLPSDEFSAPVGIGYALPNRAKELLGPPLPGIA